MVMTQEQIRKNVVDQLYWDSRVEASEINVDISDGLVTLSGTVPNYLARQAAEADAWSIPGVAAVSNQLHIRYPTARVAPSDSDIQSNIRNVFMWNPNLNSMRIEVTVDNRRVTLKGSVDAYWKKKLAEDLTFDVSGVTVVTNELSVVPSGNYLDQSIAENLTAALERNKNIDIERINVEVRDGIITLTGSVSDWIVFRAAQEAAEHTPGAVNVRNFLSIGRA